jgi:hypothetical protein
MIEIFPIYMTPFQQDRLIRVYLPPNYNEVTTGGVITTYAACRYLEAMVDIFCKMVDKFPKMVDKSSDMVDKSSKMVDELN